MMLVLGWWYSFSETGSGPNVEDRAHLKGLTENRAVQWTKLWSGCFGRLEINPHIWCV
jgi:hypothetical protein